MALFPVIFSEP